MFLKSKIFLSIILVLVTQVVEAQKKKEIEILSPDMTISVKVSAGEKLEWSVQRNGRQVLNPSSISLQINDGGILGNNPVIKSSKSIEVNTAFDAINYKKKTVKDHYIQVRLECKNNFGVIFRVYNDAVAYRFFTSRPGEIIINNEEANFNFPDDYRSFIPYMWDYRDGRIFNCSFESLYTVQKISQFRKDSLAFLPLLVDAGNGEKVAIMEADLEDYPGMFLDKNDTGKGFKGIFAPYPLKEKQVGINFVPIERAGYIAKTSGTREFPWRAIILSTQDKDLLNNDLVQKLASPCRLKDVSWVEPGQVAWDWWNDWNISQVDFKAGINTETYKYYIDFAAANHIKYIIMDAGWSDNRDLTKTQPAINLPEIIDHGNKMGVGVILWAGWHALVQQVDDVFSLYSRMGIKGFKIDFFDRDDQLAVASTYDIAKKAAEYHLMVDYHGIFKPTGLQRTYPNVIGYEGVKGMENVKWAVEDVPRYDVTIPFIRMLAGPMDYTPGAMRNSNKENFRPINSNPMSQGTRCHQLAMYVVFDAPLQMLSDNPTIYIKEQECTDFITKVPVTFDETLSLDGRVGELAVLARKKGTSWYLGAMTNWDQREITLDFSFLDPGEYEAVIFKDGVNADRQASDYKMEKLKVAPGSKMKIQLSPGGGWVARLEKIK
jgi:alpha-glucosidase